MPAGEKNNNLRQLIWIKELLMEKDLAKPGGSANNWPNNENLATKVRGARNVL
jgi:hypothetical protein